MTETLTSLMNNVNTVGDLLKLRYNKETEFTWNILTNTCNINKSEFGEFLFINLNKYIMSKNEIFTFTAPNGVEVTAVVVKELSYRVMAGDATTQYLCYSQNRLFTYEKVEDVWHKERPVNYKYGGVIVDYCIIPEYDTMLENYSKK